MSLYKLLAAIAFTLSLAPMVRSAHAQSSDEGSSIDLSSSAGIKWEIRPEGKEWRAIEVPAGGWRAQGLTCDEATYRTVLAIPNYSSTEHVYVSFDAVNFGADVFAGPDEAHLTKITSHINGWMPFKADITSVAKPGSSLLLQVEVKGRKKFRVNGNGQYTVPEGAPWSPLVEDGILRGIHLVVLPAVHIDDIFMKTRVDLGTMEAQVTASNDGDSAEQVSVKPSLSSWNHATYSYPDIPDASVTIDPHSTKTVNLGPVKWTASPESYWWPNIPYRNGYQAQLHILTVALKQNDRVLHRYAQRFGFRQFKVAGNHYELNGVRCNLRGDNLQEANFKTDAYGTKKGFGPPTADNGGWPQAIDNLQRVNFNVLRIHQIPATPYMLDVCDEKGFMLVLESPLRGANGAEDFVHGRDNMLNMDRELVRRDRNHPAGVIWSPLNEWNEEYLRQCTPVMIALDDTRPFISERSGDSPGVFEMDHYINGANFPFEGGPPRADQPYGETEAISGNDSSLQGFAWMATSIRIRRLLGDSDLRNYTLNNSWPNWVPGESAETELNELGQKILPPIENTWSNPHILLLQSCYHPTAVCDVDFDEKNAHSNRAGDWPVFQPRLRAGARITRTLAVFNDEFSSEDVTVKWELHRDNKDGPLLTQGDFSLKIPLGEFRKHDIQFDTPPGDGPVCLVLQSWKDGQPRFLEDKIIFQVDSKLQSHPDRDFEDGDYVFINMHSQLRLEISREGNKSPWVVQDNDPGDRRVTWHLTNLGGNDITLVEKPSGLALAVDPLTNKNGTLLLAEKPDGNPRQIWHLRKLGEGVWYLINKASGKGMDVLRATCATGPQIEEWDSGGGSNQLWEIQ